MKTPFFSLSNENVFKQPSFGDESRGISGSFAPLKSLIDNKTVKFLTSQDEQLLAPIFNVGLKTPTMGLKKQLFCSFLNGFETKNCFEYAIQRGMKRPFICTKKFAKRFMQSKVVVS